ncbi:carboxylesterase/lipase family protein [Bosea sp. (in: a-proteobacteria)]|uniref:carboxylesterase/lipase family protein n=1 Tax=Bosea sp. (in: a-proteobacteria) TaxID=1871050 RepID=UPI002B493CA5|nr:carboxylesterase family protein [Bosea sp. (in: a-proteobacteria)]WRH57931.1 MAG: carboxylesterase family protein [Bosea sp. (in: a-proteobacteria)]
MLHNASREAAPDERIIVETPFGRLRGERSGAILCFKGVPYAAAPVGALRFRPPQPLKPWAGTRDALTFAPVAPQPPDPGFYPGDPDAMPPIPASEDCLYLNIWTPAAAGPHPVLVWLHGGSQIVGGTSRPVYDGAAFARAGVTCVTVGHRLGLLGFLEGGRIFGECFRGSGNSALRDIVAALSWVRQAIAVFGGDPGRVTIGGESAGAKNVAALLAAPSAKGLFHAAFSSSGGGDTVHAIDGADAVAGRALALAGCDVRYLQTMPVADLIALQTRLSGEEVRRQPFRAVLDGAFLPDTPQRLVPRERVPVLMGTARDEVAALLSEPQRASAKAPQAWDGRQLTHLPPSLMAEAEARALRLWPGLPANIRRLRLLTAEEYELPSIRLAEAHAAAGGPTWVYRNDRPLAVGPFAGLAPHVADLGLIWNQPGPYGTPTALGERGMHEVVATFIRTGTVPWTQYSAERRATQVFRMGGAELQMDPSEDMRRIFDGLFHL